MARISEKALRPRHYVFNRVPKAKIELLAPRIKKLRDQERRKAIGARAARRHAVPRHGDEMTEAQPESGNGIRNEIDNENENDQIAELEQELQDLTQRKQELFDKLRETFVENRRASSSSAKNRNNVVRSSVATNAKGGRGRGSRPQGHGQGQGQGQRGDERRQQSATKGNGPRNDKRYHHDGDHHRDDHHRKAS